MNIYFHICCSSTSKLNRKRFQYKANMTHLSNEERERSVMRIFEAALAEQMDGNNAYAHSDAMDVSTTFDGHASSSWLDLIRHVQSVVDEIPPTGIDDDYVLRLQSQLAIARCTIHRQEEESQTTPISPSPVLSARQLAETASRRQRRVSRRNSELSEALTMAASLQIDLERTREHMSDAISVARNRSNSTRSLSLMDALDLDDDEVEDTTTCINTTPTRGENNDDLVAGPFVGPLNDIELNDVTITNAPTSASGVSTGTRAGPANRGQVDDMLTSIATLEFDLLQTREQLADERSFNKSSGSLEALLTQQDNGTGEGSYDIVSTTRVEQQKDQEQATVVAPTSIPSNTNANTDSPPTHPPPTLNASGAPSQEADNSSGSNNMARTPKTESAVQGTRMHPSVLRRRSYTNRSA